MKKGLVAVAAGLILATAMSGCFIMRTLTFTKDIVDAGKKTTAKVTVVGETEDGMRALGAARGPSSDEYPFFYLASEIGTVLTNGGVFDETGVFEGPVDLKKDAALTAVASDECAESFSPRRGPSPAETIVVTEEPFTATSVRKIMDARLPIRVPESSGNIDGFGIFMGTWGDDGDGIPEDEGTTDDDYRCQPPYVTTLNIKGGGGPPKP